LGGNINALAEKPREIKNQLLNNPQQLDSILAEGCQKARQEASKTLAYVRERMKFRGGI
jgi:tryptophanyl-tRNA synthetase